MAKIKSFVLVFIALAVVVGLATVVFPKRDSSTAQASLSELRASVYKEYPRLDPRARHSEQLDDWDKVRMLREYSHRHTCYVTSSQTAAYEAGMEIVSQQKSDRLSLKEAYESLSEGKGGVLCGGQAAMLRSLYHAFGYDAWALGHGFRPATENGSRFTHAQVLEDYCRDG